MLNVKSVGELKQMTMLLLWLAQVDAGQSGWEASALPDRLLVFWQVKFSFNGAALCCIPAFF